MQATKNLSFSASGNGNSDELANTRHTISQNINNVRPWWSDIIVWWTSHKQILVDATGYPIRIVQLAHSGTHMV